MFENEFFSKFEQSVWQANAIDIDFSISLM